MALFALLRFLWSSRLCWRLRFGFLCRGGLLERCCLVTDEGTTDEDAATMDNNEERTELIAGPREKRGTEVGGVLQDKGGPKVVDPPQEEGRTEVGGVPRGRGGTKVVAAPPEEKVAEVDGVL